MSRADGHSVACFQLLSDDPLSKLVGRLFQFKTAFGTMSSAHDVRITVPDWGTEYRGTIKMSPGFNALMTVVQSGGADNGKTWTLYPRSAY